MRKPVVATVSILALVLMLASCTSGGTTKAGGTGGTTPATASAADAREASRAPGVTPDAIKVGVVYVDQKLLQESGIDLQLGDYQGSYEALIEQINASGGINGRQLQVVYAAVNPAGTAPADVACLHLVEDEKVFVAVGFFLNDAVLCPVATHDTAVIGGAQDPQLMAQATAPWFTTNAGSEVPVSVVKSFDRKHLLTGKIGVFAHSADADLVNNQIMPELDKLGVKTDKAILDAPAGDTAAIDAGTQAIAQRFKADGVTKVLLVGPSSADWFLGMSDQPYQPQLLISDETAVQSFIANATTHDTSLLKGSVVGSALGQSTWVYDDPPLQACFKTLEKAGIAVPEPDANDPNQKGYTGPEDACVNVALLKALLTRAGRNLNYATFRRAGDTLGTFRLPGDPVPRVYGPYPASDGSPQPTLTTWDEATKSYVPESS